MDDRQRRTIASTKEGRDVRNRNGVVKVLNKGLSYLKFSRHNGQYQEGAGIDNRHSWAIANMREGGDEGRYEGRDEGGNVRNSNDLQA